MALKTENPKAWLFILPVIILVAFNALIPLMTVVNYSVQETFGNNIFLWSGVRWFEEILNSERFHAALGRQLVFTGIILAIEIPLGVAIALTMPRQGPWVPVCLVMMALPLLIPWNVVGAMWNIFALPDIGMLGHTLNSWGIDYNYTRQPFSAWATLIAMDVWHWTSLVVLLAYAGLSAIPSLLVRCFSRPSFFSSSISSEIPSVSRMRCSSMRVRLWVRHSKMAWACLASSELAHDFRSWNLLLS